MEAIRAHGADHAALAFDGVYLAAFVGQQLKRADAPWLGTSWMGGVSSEGTGLLLSALPIQFVSEDSQALRLGVGKVAADLLLFQDDQPLDLSLGQRRASHTVAGKVDALLLGQLKEGPTVPFCDVEALCQVPNLSREGVARGPQVIQLGTIED